jgi:hypothetical protein
MTQGPGEAASLSRAIEENGAEFLMALGRAAGSEERARRRCIVAAVTPAALREARDLGHNLAVLGSSEMGHGVYRGPGFIEYCRIGLYEWRPGV